MNHTDGKFKVEGLGELYYQGWQPEGEVKAVIFITHGLAEYGGRYKNVVDAYVNDPLVYTGKTTARLGAELLNAMTRLLAERSKIKLPIILMHGSDDGLSDPDGSQELHDAVSSEDKTLKFYQDYYHEIFKDPGKEVVLEDLYQWLEAHL